MFVCVEKGMSESIGEEVAMKVEIHKTQPSGKEVYTVPDHHEDNLRILINTGQWHSAEQFAIKTWYKDLNFSN